MKLKIYFLSILIVTSLVSCSTIHKAEEAVGDVEQGSTETGVFNISAAQADSVIRKAFSEGWPDKELAPLGGNRAGYQIMLWFAIDREHIIAETISAGSGFLFRVTNRGTAPVVGVPARKKLIERINKIAAEEQQSN